MKKLETISMTILKKVIRYCLCVMKINARILTTSVAVAQDTMFITTMMTTKKSLKKNMKRKEASNDREAEKTYDVGY